MAACMHVSLLNLSRIWCGSCTSKLNIIFIHFCYPTVYSLHGYKLCSVSSYASITDPWRHLHLVLGSYCSLYSVYHDCWQSYILVGLNRMNAWVPQYSLYNMMWLCIIPWDVHVALYNYILYNACLPKVSHMCTNAEYRTKISGKL